jgi:hypothetical protein
MDDVFFPEMKSNSFWINHRESGSTIAPGGFSKFESWLLVLPVTLVTALLSRRDSELLSHEIWAEPIFVAAGEFHSPDKLKHVPRKSISYWPGA